MSFDPKFLRWAILNQIPFAAAIMAVLAGVTIVVAQFVPVTHTATARLLVEATSVSPQARAPSDALTDAAHLQNIENRIMTQSRVAALVAQMGVDLSVEAFRKGAGFNTTSGRGKATTLAVSFAAKDPDFATTATNLLAEQVVSEHRAIRTERAEDALKFFRQEVAESRKRLDEKLAGLLWFKSAHSGALPTDLATLSEQRKTLSAQASVVPAPRKMTAAQARLQSDLDAARAIYSDQHPKIQLLQTKLNRLGSTPATAPPKHAGLTEKLADLDASLAAIPANELKLQALQRDHDLSEAQYKSAVSRLEAAAIEERIAMRENGDRLSIIEHAQLPDLQGGSRHRLILAFGLALSVLTALATAFLRARADPYMRRPFDLESGLGLRAYAVIPTLKPLQANS